MIQIVSLSSHSLSLFWLGLLSYKLHLVQLNHIKYIAFWFDKSVQLYNQYHNWNIELAICPDSLPAPFS